MRLASLHPQFLGAGGEGVRQPSGRTCPACAGAGCAVCHRTGKEYEPAPERHGVGLMFDCPCPTCTAQRTGDPRRDFHLRVYVGFANPLDGAPPYDPRPGAQWTRQGETFDTLVLRPSILSVAGKGGCGWHGFVGGADGSQPGEVVTC